MEACLEILEADAESSACGEGRCHEICLKIAAGLALISFTVLCASCSKKKSLGGTEVLRCEMVKAVPFEPAFVEYKEVIQPPSRDGMNTAQKEFWDYLNQFNRLPENASEEAVAIYSAKGTAPSFEYLSPSLFSVLGDIEGLKKHRDLFALRYPWVKSLTVEYGLEIAVSEKRFSGTAKEIGNKYSSLVKKFRGWDNKEYTEAEYVSSVLEGLLVVDYVYARGTESDRDSADDIWRGVFTAFYMSHSFEKELAHKLIIPATRDIGWATIAAYPEKMWGQTPSMLLSGFRLHAPLKPIPLLNLIQKHWAYGNAIALRISAS